MTSVSHVTAMYATKRRRRNSKNVRTVCTKNSPEDTNASKRHRERLNKELDNLAELLPYEQSVLSKLDKLSILRLSVSYLRTKSYFQAALASGRLASARNAHYPQTGSHQNQNHHNQFRSQQQQQMELHHAGHQNQQQQLQPTASYPLELQAEGDLIVQALNGFLLILTCEGEVFYTSQSVDTYLGFHQSDICHQSVYELVHSEDREELMQQLKWDYALHHHTNHLHALNGTSSSTTTNTTTASSGSNGNPLALSQVGGGAPDSKLSLQEILASADHRHLLERNFTVRFRCLLDNTSGFSRLDIRGRIKVLHGQQNQQSLGNSASSVASNERVESKLEQREPMLAFFGVCIPYGPPNSLEVPTKDSAFESKHRLDLSLIDMDKTGREVLGLKDLNFSNFGENSQMTSQVKPVASGKVSCASGGIENNSLNGVVGAKVSAVSVKLETSSSTTTATTTTSMGAAATSGGNSNKAQQTPLNAVKQKHNLSVYDLVHQDDLTYMSSAHQELLKTGQSVLIAYRMLTQHPGAKYQWLQTHALLVNNHSKPEYIKCSHWPLMEEEGLDLLGKRTMDFKVTYFDENLRRSKQQPVSNSSSCSPTSSSSASRSAVVSATASKLLLACDTKPSGKSSSAAAIRYMNSSSPGDGSLASSRSITSLSPVTVSQQSNATSGAKSKRKSQQQQQQHQYSASSGKYDLTNNPMHPISQYQASNDPYADPSGYLNGQVNGSGDYAAAKRMLVNGYHQSTFYDMDAGQTEQTLPEPVTRIGKGSAKKKAGGGKATGGSGGSNKSLSTKKQKLMEITESSSVEEQQQVAAAAAAAAAAATMHQHHHHLQNQPVVGMDLYNHHNHHHHQYNGQSAHAMQDSQSVVGDTTSQAAYATAAAYAQHYGSSATAASHHSLHQQQQHNQQHNHHQQQQHQHHQAITNHHQAYASHHHHQSLYGNSAAAAAAAAATYNSAHHHMHSLDSHGNHHHYHHHQPGYTSNPTTGASGHPVATAAAAAAAAFLPATEHLLQHYSQSARSAAAAAQLAAWPTGASATDSSAAQYQAAAAAGYPATVTGAWDTNTAVLAAAALTNGSNATVAATDANAARAINAYHKSCSNIKQHGPASLNSDGSAHRSPLSSGESSNGSAFVTGSNNVNGLSAPQSVSITSNEPPSASANSNTTASPSSYYLSGVDHHNASSTNQQTSPYGASYAAQQNHYASTAGSMRQHYSTTNTTDQQQQQYLSHHHHSQQQVSGNQYQAIHNQTSAQQQQQHHQQLDSSSHYHAYFHAANGDVSSGAATGAVDSTAAAALKLYGSSNGGQVEMNSVSNVYYAPLTNATTTTPTTSTNNHNNNNNNSDEWRRLPVASSQVVYTPLQVASYNPTKLNGYSYMSESSGYDIDKSRQSNTSHWMELGDRASKTCHLLGPSVDGHDNNKDDMDQTERESSGNQSCSHERGETLEKDYLRISSDRKDKEKDKVGRDEDKAKDSRDPLAKLISSTIGDLMLDVAP